MLHLYYDYSSIKRFLVKDVHNTFDNKAEDMWFYDDFSFKVIEEIDVSQLLPPRKVDHRFFGVSSVTKISKYSKVFILLKHLNKRVYRLSDIHSEHGDYLKELAEKQDLHIYCDCYFDWDQDQVARLPEYSSNIKGVHEINSVFRLHTRSPEKVASLRV